MLSYILFFPQSGVFHEKKIQQEVCLFYNPWRHLRGTEMKVEWWVPSSTFSNAFFEIKRHYQSKTIWVLVIFLNYMIVLSNPNLKCKRFLKTYFCLMMSLAGSSSQIERDVLLDAGVSYEHSNTQFEHLKLKRKRRTALSERFCKC